TIPSGENKKISMRAFFSDREYSLNEKLESLHKNDSLKFIHGGKTRTESTLFALKSIKTKPDFVLIHDVARPFVSKKIIRNVAKKVVKCNAVAPCIESSDTQKIVNSNGIIKEHLKREFTKNIQTPQAFNFEKILEAHKKASKDRQVYTDDTEIWARYIGEVATVKGSIENKKITYKSDINMENTKAKDASVKAYQTFRVGLGYDLHRLEENRKLILGGITLPSKKGEVAHSDGDVLLHAITDAILGAVAISDIGELFPDTCQKWKDASSKDLLKTAWQKVNEQGWKILNIDCVIKLEEPKFIPYREKVRESIAKILKIDTDQIFVKAKTGEKLGSVGNGLAVEVWCTCLLAR
ncbi:MAG: 2-C-methyl-D-erythritol 2,4-cyclodiphosphate synthase, partial [Treponema sp.]|nr:2-C-methyl-D-erythritol 2,4-cyclodiphosphate synthase [Treponema sp.]